MPKVYEGRNLTVWLNELRYTGSGFNGPVPLTWQEIDAWARMTQTELTPNEALILSELSGAYCSQYHKSSDINEIAPYREDGKEGMSNVISAMIGIANIGNSI